MEKKILKKLEQLIRKEGYAKTASLIGEYDTQCLKKWIKNKRIPFYKQNIINSYLTRG